MVRFLGFGLDVFVLERDIERTNESRTRNFVPFTHLYGPSVSPAAGPKYYARPPSIVPGRDFCPK